MMLWWSSIPSSRSKKRRNLDFTWAREPLDPPITGRTVCPNVGIADGEPSTHGPSVWTGRALQSSERIGWSCASVSGPWVEQIAPGHHGYQRVRSQFSDRPSKARWATRSRTRRRDHSPFLKFNSQTSAGYLLLPSGALGLTEAIPSEPPSLARPDRRADDGGEGWRSSLW